MAALNGHPQIRLTPNAVRRFRVWMVSRYLPGSAEDFIGGLLYGGEPMVTDLVLVEVMAAVDQLIALHGHRWFAVLQARGAGVDHGVLPVEPRLN